MYIQNPEQFIKENPINKLDEGKAKEIYDKLVEDLNYHNYLYYVKSQPVISDYEYDLLFHYLEDLENKFPQFIRKDSPTQRLTNQIQSELKKAKHTYPLLSLENTYNPNDVEEKLIKIEKDVNAKNMDFYIEPKYDGLSIELIYEDGFFKQAITRWDGFIWEDVTENAKTINTMPLKISYKWKLHVRWEVVVKKTIFEKINQEREKQGLETYSNPRNLASGSLRQLDASITASRKLDVICYEVLNFKETWLSYHHESLDFLEKNWFWVFDFKTIGDLEIKWDLGDKLKLSKPRHWLKKEEILEIVKSQEIKDLLDKQDVEFDWLVIKVDNEKYWSVLWNTAHHPKRAFAFKYPAKQVSTQLLDVELSVWRTGVITPVAILDPIEIDGVIVKRSTLHNFDFIKEKDIHIEDYLWIQRSGEVIPYVDSVIKERRNKGDLEIDGDFGDEKKCENLIKNYLQKIKKRDYKYWYLSYSLKYNLCDQNIIDYGYLIKIIEVPYCPVCGGETFRPDWEVALRCINVACPAQVKEKLSYFVSKHWLDIEWLSEKTIELLLEVWLIKDYWDIFVLPEKRQELLTLPGFKEKKVENIIRAIEEKKEVSLDMFLQALWIEFIWKKTAKLIVENLEINDQVRTQLTGAESGLKGDYVNFQKLVNFLVSEEWEEFLMWINWIWPKVIQSIKKFFHEKHNQQVVEKLLKYIKIKQTSFKKWKFSGELFVITGSIEWIPRDKIEKWIEENWWDFSNQVTKETTLLLVGEKPWNSKIKKAQEYNISSYDLYKFLKENWFSFPTKVKVQEGLF